MAATRPTSSRPSDAARAPAPATPGADDQSSFADLGVPPSLVTVLVREGITSPFPIQRATLPDSLAGRDVLGRGKTGSGKTLAFVLPVLTRLAESATNRRPGHPRALILAPTRELVSQIHEAIQPLAEPLGLKTVTVFGGVGQGPQINAFRKGVDIVVACPGRLEDLMGQGHVKLDAIEITVLDEADHMADLGFLPVVKRYLSSPITHSVDSEQSPVAAMTHHVLHIKTADRLDVLVDLTAAPGRTMVFTRTKHRAKQLTRQLNAAGVPAVEMHGNLAQNARTRNLAAFSEGRATALVATDIAARGIHVDDVSLVIHADPPIEHKAYLHRSGRTARAGNDGTVVTLATEDQRRDVVQLARKAGIKPTTTALRPGDPLLTELAPGPRTVLTAAEIVTALDAPVRPGERTGAGTGSSRRRSSGGGSRGNGGGRGSGGGRSSSGGRGSGGSRSGGSGRTGTARTSSGGGAGAGSGGRRRARP